MNDVHEPDVLDDQIVGSTIVSIRSMTASEMEAEGWEKREVPIVLVLSTGITLYPSMDTEGNDAGALFGKTSDNISFVLC